MQPVVEPNRCKGIRNRRSLLPTAHPISHLSGLRLPQNPSMKKLLTIPLLFSIALSAQQPFRVTITGHGQPMILIPWLSSSGETWDGTVDRYPARYNCHVLPPPGL